MVKSTSVQSRYRTLFTNGLYEAYADTTEDKGGGGSGFRPHDLLKAALSTCLNMEIRIYADHHNIPLSEVHTEVRLDRSRPDETVFKYSIELVGTISDDQRQKLLHIAKACSVHKTLSKKLVFENTSEI
jgi:putative redox protein